MQNEKDGDFGYDWLKTKYAGSGPFTIRDWKANEVVVLERNPNYEKKTPLARVIYRHIKETATQRLLLEKGDVDVARNLNPEEIAAVSKNPDIKIDQRPQGHGLVSRPEPEEPEPGQARSPPGAEIPRRLLGDRRHDHEEQGRGSPGLPAQGLPRRRVNDNPYKLDVAKAKELLAKAGLKDGFSVTMDTRSHRRDHRHRAGDPADLRSGRREARDHPGRRQADPDQVPRPPARHLYRQLGLGLSGSELQRRHLRGQRRQLGQRQGQAPRMAQCLGSGPADRQDPRCRAWSGTPRSAPRCTRNCRSRFSTTARS